MATNKRKIPEKPLKKNQSHEMCHINLFPYFCLHIIAIASLFMVGEVGWRKMKKKQETGRVDVVLQQITTQNGGSQTLLNSRGQTNNRKVLKHQFLGKKKLLATLHANAYRSSWILLPSCFNNKQPPMP
jgi:hypothetical protein